MCSWSLTKYLCVHLSRGDGLYYIELEFHTLYFEQLSLEEAKEEGSKTRCKMLWGFSVSIKKWSKG